MINLIKSLITITLLILIPTSNLGAVDIADLDTVYNHFTNNSDFVYSYEGLGTATGLVGKINSNFLNLNQATPQEIINGFPTYENGHADFSEAHQLVDKEYVDQAVTAINIRYYSLDTASGVEDYKLTQIAIPSESEASVTGTDLTDNEYIQGWISPVGGTPTILPSGEYVFRITAEKTAGTKTLKLYWTLVEYKADTSEVVIATSETSDEFTTKTTQEIFLALTSDHTPEVGSRIIGKVHADVSGTGNAPTGVLYYLGTAPPHWAIPSQTEVLDGLYIQSDGGSTTTASIPFAEGLSVGTGKHIVVGTTQWDDGSDNIDADAIVDGSTNAIPTLTQETNWDTAYGWGDHASQNYFDIDDDTLDNIPDGTTYKLLTATKDGYIDQDVTSGSAPNFTADNFSDGGTNAIITTTQETNFDTAYGWGNHAGLYLTDAGTVADNSIPTFDGTDGVTTQPTGVTIDDSDNVATSGTISTIEIYNTAGDLKIQPDIQGDVILFGDTDMGDAVDGKKLIISRNNAGAVGDHLVEQYIDQYGRFYFLADSQAMFQGPEGTWSFSYQPYGGGIDEHFRFVGSGETGQDRHYGYITGASTQKYIQTEVNDTTDNFELTREDANILGFDIQMPLITDAITIGTGSALTVGSTVWTSSDEFDGTKIKDADYGEITIDADGVWTIDDSVTVTGWTMGASTATTPSADDNDTSLATTAFVQGEINGAGGRSLTCASGSCDADAELYTSEKNIYYEAPAVEAKDNIICGVMNDITITYVKCITDAGTVSINLEDGSDNNILSAELVCDTGGQTSCASGCDVNTINSSYDNITAKTEDIDLDISAVSSATEFSLMIGYTVDD